MYDDLLVWFTLVQKYVSNTAFIEDGRVYIRDGGIHEVPVYDPATFVQFLNFNPHLLPATYEAWRQRDENRIERGFCIALYEQTIEEERIRASVPASVITEAGQSAMRQLVTALAGMGFEVMMSPECRAELDAEVPDPAPVAEFPLKGKPINEIFQSALFASLNK